MNTYIPYLGVAVCAGCAVATLQLTALSGLPPGNLAVHPPACLALPSLALTCCYILHTRHTHFSLAHTHLSTRTHFQNRIGLITVIVIIIAARCHHHYSRLAVN